MMPSEVGLLVEKIEFGGMFLAQRVLQSRRTWSQGARRYMEPASASEASVRTIPSLNAAEGNSKTNDEPFPAQESGSIERKHADSKGSEELLATGSRDKICSESKKLLLPEGVDAQASDAWRVQHHGIHRLKGLVDNERFSRPLIEQLLVETLSDLPLASEGRGCALSAGAIALCWSSFFGGSAHADLTKFAATSGPYAPRCVFTDVSCSQDIPINPTTECCRRVGMSKRNVTLNRSVGDSMMAKRRQAKEKLGQALESGSPTQESQD